MGKITFEDTRRGLSGGQEEALLRKLWLAAGGEESGQEGLAVILRDEQRITLVEALIKWTDQHGRLIPPAGFQPSVVDANRNFHLTQPTVDYAVVLSRLMEHLPGLTFASAQDFQIRAMALVEMLRADAQAKNLLRGVYLPVTLPQITVDDYGTTLEEVFLVGVGKSYQAQFPDRKFVNQRKGTLARQVTNVQESRQDRLLAKLAEGPVTGIYFPVALQGFSIPAAREIMTMLPEGFVLTGGIETATALTAYPGTLARDYQTPGLDCAVNVWRSPGFSLVFGAGDGQLEFYHGGLGAYGYYSSGLLFLG